MRALTGGAAMGVPMGPRALIRAAFRGEWRAIAILSALLLVPVLYCVIIYLRERKARSAAQDRWVVPSAEEVARVVKSGPGDTKGERNDPG